MFRRRYLFLSGAVLLAGCQTKETGASSTTPTPTETRTTAPEPAETATETETSTETETATETETPELTGTDLAAANIQEAEAAIERGYEAYLDQAEGTATSLLDVGPETTGFDAARVTVPLETARTLLDEASEEANDPQQGQIIDRRSAADWLGGAARVQSALSGVTDSFVDAAAAGDQGESYVVVSDRLEATFDRLPAVDTAMAERPTVDEQFFRGIDAVEGTEAVRKDERFERQQSGLLDVRWLIEAAMDAAALVSSALSSINAENYDRAEQEAQRAIAHLDEIEPDATGIEPESLRPMTERFLDVLVHFRDRAVEIRETARAELA